VGRDELSELKSSCRSLPPRERANTVLFGAGCGWKIRRSIGRDIISSLAADEDLISESRWRRRLSNVFAQPPVREQHPPPQIHIEPERRWNPSAHEKVFRLSNRCGPRTPAAESSRRIRALPVTHTRKRSTYRRESRRKNRSSKNRNSAIRAVTRGDLKKRPTIVEGEDLRRPTYLRKNQGKVECCRGAVSAAIL